jgi:hypothetical protein
MNNVGMCAPMGEEKMAMPKTVISISQGNAKRIDNIIDLVRTLSLNVGVEDKSIECASGSCSPQSVNSLREDMIYQDDRLITLCRLVNGLLETIGN